MRQNEPNIYIEEKKWGQSEVTGNAAGRRGPRRDVASASSGDPRRAPRARPRRARRNHVRALATGTPYRAPPSPDKDDAILFSIYYVCRFLLFFRISIFYFLVDVLRNSPVVLDPFRSVERSHDRQFSILLSSEENCRVRRYRVGLITFKRCLQSNQLITKKSVANKLRDMVTLCLAVAHVLLLHRYLQTIVKSMTILFKK